MPGIHEALQTWEPERELAALEALDAGEPQLEVELDALSGEEDVEEDPLHDGSSAPGNASFSATAEAPKGSSSAESASASAPSAEEAKQEPRRNTGGRQDYWTKERIIVAIEAWAEEHGQPPRQRDWQRASDDHPSFVTVVERFGRWAEGIVAAGFPRPRPGGWNRGKPGTTSRKQAPSAGGADERRAERRLARPARDPEGQTRTDAPTPRGVAEPVAGPSWISVARTGLKYRTPMEGFAAADELEHQAEQEAEQLRHDGHDDQAERVMDRARERCDLIRAAMRAEEERAARRGVPPEPSTTDDLLPMFEKQLEEAEQRVQALRQVVEGLRVLGCAHG